MTTTPLPATINGSTVNLDVDPATPLADVLRDQCGLTATHIGCRNGDCGACTVLLDHQPYKSCLVPGGRAAGRAIETLDELAEDDTLHPVQQQFWDHNAFQCGFCLAGQVLCTLSTLRHNPDATDDELTDALAGNLCRCTGYQQITAAARAARTHNTER